MPVDHSLHVCALTRARMGRYDDGEEEDLDLEEVRLCFTSFLEFKML